MLTLRVMWVLCFQSLVCGDGLDMARGLTLKQKTWNSLDRLRKLVPVSSVGGDLGVRTPPELLDGATVTGTGVAVHKYTALRLDGPRAEAVGSGSLGLVWRVPLELLPWDVDCKVVAVKVNGVKCADRKAMTSELSQLELLTSSPHDHVIRVLGVCSDAPDGWLRVVMPFYPGLSLGQVLSNRAKVCCPLA